MTNEQIITEVQLSNSDGYAPVYDTRGLNFEFFKKRVNQRVCYNVNLNTVSIKKATNGFAKCKNQGYHGNRGHKYAIEMCYNRGYLEAASV